METARAHAHDSCFPVQPFKLQSSQVEECVLFSALSDFERELAQRTGTFNYEAGTISFTQRIWTLQEEKRIKVPELSFKVPEVSPELPTDKKDQKTNKKNKQSKRGKQPKKGQSVSPVVKAAEKSKIGHLRVITSIRHWLFHHTDYKFDASDVLFRMGRTLHLLTGLQHGQECPPGDGPPEGWNRWQELLESVRRTQTVHVELCIQINRMSIPLPTDTVFEGRAGDLESAVTKMLRPGARVLPRVPFLFKSMLDCLPWTYFAQLKLGTDSRHGRNREGCSGRQSGAGPPHCQR